MDMEVFRESSEIRSVPRGDDLEMEKEKTEKRERTGWATWLVKRGRIIGRQTLADTLCQ